MACRSMMPNHDGWSTSVIVERADCDRTGAWSAGDAQPTVRRLQDGRVRRSTPLRASRSNNTKQAAAQRQSARLGLPIEDPTPAHVAIVATPQEEGPVSKA
jgi:hypothetical protein